ncbi:hypothetical protein QVZ41_14135 [Wenyingzhuangia sp. chi5]|uniref:Uncharacterized protein n=1 Tax=Wenyingzhuangia gilva TaxID=3057677 RepID=A0ABT8VVN2_9FLAO|nr:hypothetical protein [Wenyingzhuangia sp. chi5]MDO3695987.1 hypothetical protein [Wenyingzhuangia sp. chi5]
MTEEHVKHRINNALTLLKEGNRFTVGELLFESISINEFSVTGWSINNNLNNISKQSAISELNEIKSLFEKMIIISPELSAFLKNKLIKYHLNFDTGKASIKICSEISGKIKWKIEI